MDTYTVEKDKTNGMWSVKDGYAGRVLKYFVTEQEARQWVCDRLNAQINERSRF